MKYGAKIQNSPNILISHDGDLRKYIEVYDTGCSVDISKQAYPQHD